MVDAAAVAGFSNSTHAETTLPTPGPSFSNLTLSSPSSHLVVWSVARYSHFLSRRLALSLRIASWLISPRQVQLSHLLPSSPSFLLLPLWPSCRKISSSRPSLHLADTCPTSLNLTRPSSPPLISFLPLPVQSHTRHPGYHPIPSSAGTAS